MVIRLGDKRTHHFAHKVDTASCSTESVWHQSAKYLFHETFSRCVAKQQPLFLAWYEHDECTHYEQLGFRCAVPRKKQVDLAAAYDEAIIEGVIDNYRADVLLTSVKNQPPMLIEFTVTHACTPEKLASGHRIVEISLGCDADVARLATPSLDSSSTDLRRHNFVPELESSDYCNGKCDRMLYVLRVYRNNGARIEAVTAMEAHQNLDPGVRYQEILGNHGPIDVYERGFKNALVRYWGKKNYVRSCYLCVFHGSCGPRFHVYCKLLKNDLDCNTAVSCSKFKPFKSMEEFVLQDRRNQLFKNTPWGTILPPRPKR